MTKATKSADEMTLAEHAEAWWSEHGKRVPPRHTNEWQTMYEKFIGFAFKDFGKTSSYTTKA